MPQSFSLRQGPAQSRHWRVWNGSNGKYEIVAGSYRTKWNNYSTTSRTVYNKPGPIMLRGLCTSSGPYYMKYIVYPFWGGDSLTYIGDASLDTSVSASQQNAVLQKLLTKIKGHDFDLGVELGQMRQTVSLLSGNLGKLGRAAVALKRGDFVSAARQLGARSRSTNLKGNDISGRWLELQYGWLPLLSSSFEAAKAFESMSNGPRRTTFEASVSTTRTSNELSLSPGNFSAKCQGKLTRRLKYEMYEEMSAPRQLGLADPASILWELTPWSFVVDWFVPIGSYLDNLNQIPHLLGRWLITDMVQYAEQVPTWKWISTAHQSTGPLPGEPSGVLVRGSTISVVSWPNPRVSAVKINRTFSSSPPSVPFPGIKASGAIHGNRLWNAIALAYQRFS